MIYCRILCGIKKNDVVSSLFLVLIIFLSQFLLVSTFAQQSKKQKKDHFYVDE